MRTRIFEATQALDGGFNWGKFLVAEMFNEWGVKSEMHRSMGEDRSLLQVIGHSPQSLWVLDLQTGEGARFVPGGLAAADLQKHRIWVCPMFEPFLEWLYRQDRDALWSELPQLVELPAEPSFAGYRRQGPES